MIVFIVLISCCLMAGCRSQQALTQVPVETRTTVVERLVEVKTPADSTWLHAWFECDSNYNVLLRSVDEHKTAKMETALQLNDSKLTYKVVRVRDVVYIPARDSIIVKEVPYPVEVVTEVNRLTGWQYFQVWAGRIFMGLLAAYLIFKILSKKLS